MNINPLWKQLREDRFSGHTSLLELFTIEEPPIPVIGMASGLGVEVYYREDAGWESALSLNSENPEIARIFVEKDRDPEWQRFLVAHELGHLLLHSDITVHRDTKKTLMSSDRKEREANEFAAKLLMPQWMLEFAYDYMTSDLDRLALMFGVSPHQMRMRLHDSGIRRMY